MNLSINNIKTPKEASNKLKLNLNIGEEKERLNLSVDVGLKNNNNYKNLYENNMRLSRITEEKLNNSISEINSKGSIHEIDLS